MLPDTWPPPPSAPRNLRGDQPATAVTMTWSRKYDGHANEEIIFVCYTQFVFKFLQFLINRKNFLAFIYWQCSCGVPRLKVLIVIVLSTDSGGRERRGTGPQLGKFYLFRKTIVQAALLLKGFIQERQMPPHSLKRP